MTAAVIPLVDQQKKLLSEEKKLCISAKYKHLQATDWLLLEGVYHVCKAWDPYRRPTASEVVSNLGSCDNESRENTPLRVSQNRLWKNSTAKLRRESQEMVQTSPSMSL